MSSRIRKLPLAAAALGLLFAAGPSPAAQDSDRNAGKFTGKTAQESVAPSARKIEFKVKGSKVKLLTEPVVRRGFCLSAPVFTLEGETPTTRLNGRGAFSFTKTFVGSQVDKISGRYVSASRVEGTIVYHFAATDLCTAGAQHVTFGASIQKKKKK